MIYPALCIHSCYGHMGLVLCHLLMVWGLICRERLVGSCMHKSVNYLGLHKQTVGNVYAHFWHMQPDLRIQASAVFMYISCHSPTVGIEEGFLGTTC